MATTLREINKQINKYSEPVKRKAKRGKDNRIAIKDNKGIINVLDKPYYKMSLDPYSKYQEQRKELKQLNASMATKRDKMDYFAYCLSEAGFNKRYLAAKYCNSVLVYGLKHGKLVPVDVMTCGMRECPNCRGIQHAKRKALIEKVLKETSKQYPNSRFIEITVTLKNAYNATNLKESIQKLNSSLSKVMNYSGIKQFVRGYVRSDEAPLSVDNNKYGYNVHMHVMALFDKSFMSGRNRLSKKRWRQRFKQAMKLPYLPEIDVMPIHATNNNGVVRTATENAIRVSEYNVKENQLVDTLMDNEQLHNSGNDVKIVRDYYLGLKGSRKVSYSGVLNNIKKQVEAKDEIENEQTKDNSEIEAYYKYEYIFEAQSFKLVSVSNYNPLHLDKNVCKALNNNNITHGKIHDKVMQDKYGFSTYKQF